MTANLIALSVTTPDISTAGKKLALRLGLPFVDYPQDPHASLYRYLLLLTPHHLGLKDMRQQKIMPFYINFLSEKMRYRSQHASLRKEALARAIGLHPRDKPTLIDATAGLGRDSFILATLGYEVTLLERSPVLFALLEDALVRARKDDFAASIVDRLHLIQADAIHWLTALPNHARPDVIYLDPMFPPRQKSASVKKEMQILQELIGNDVDTAQLVQTALACARQRVVIKRPRLAPNLSDRPPSFHRMGKTSRFDIYLV